MRPPSTSQGSVPNSDLSARGDAPTGPGPSAESGLPGTSLSGVTPSDAGVTRAVDPRPLCRVIVFSLLMVCGLAWDLWTKYWVFAVLGYPHRSSDWSAGCPLLWGQFSIRLTTSFNQGALFGIGQGWGWLFATMSLIAIGFIIYWLFVRGESHSWWLTCSLGVVTAGILGNLYDRLYWHGCRLPDGSPLYGVRDFIDCSIPWIQWNEQFQPMLQAQWPYPIFNFADTFLVCGAISLVLQSLLVPQKEAGTVPERNPAAPRSESSLSSLPQVATSGSA